jgi:hypothetical protein
MAYNPINLGPTTTANSQAVVLPSDQVAIPVTGTFFQGTQPVSIAASVAVTGPLTDTQLRASAVPVSLASLPSLATGSNAIGSITNTTFASTQSGTWNIGAVTSITNAVTVSQGTATSLKTQAENYQGGSAVSSSNPLYVTLASSTSGGDSVSAVSSQAIVSAASTNPISIKASAGKVTGWYIYNSNASARKVAFHNTAGTPTAGSAVYLSIVIPGLSAANVSFPDGIDFSTGIAITTVTGLPNSDASIVGLNDLIINIFYK